MVTYVGKVVIDNVITEDNHEIEEISNFYINRGFKVVKRTRHHDRKGLFARIGRQYIPGGVNDVPLEYAEKIILYIYNRR